MSKQEQVRKAKEQGARYLRKGNWEKALEKYRELVKLQPKDIRVPLNIRRTESIGPAPRSPSTAAPKRSGA